MHSRRCVDLSGKVALVTGAAQGFGFACARRLAEAGAAVVLADSASRPARRRCASDSPTRARTGRGRRRRRLRGGRRGRGWSAAAVERFGRLDVLVNNAGVFSNFLLEHLTPAEFHRILGVNVGGAFLCIRAAAARMREQGDGGSIINISSIDAIHPSGCRALALRHVEACDLGPDEVDGARARPGSASA